MNMSVAWWQHGDGIPTDTECQQRLDGEHRAARLLAYATEYECAST